MKKTYFVTWDSWSMRSSSVSKCNALVEASTPGEAVDKVVNSDSRDITVQSIRDPEVKK